MAHCAPALAERVHGETHLMVAPVVTPNPYEGIMRGSRYGDRYLTAEINGLSVISVARYAADHPSDRYDTGKEPDLAITYDRKDRLFDLRPGPSLPCFTRTEIPYVD